MYFLTISLYYFLLINMYAYKSLKTFPPPSQTQGLLLPSSAPLPSFHSTLHGLSMLWRQQVGDPPFTLYKPLPSPLGEDL